MYYIYTMMLDMLTNTTVVDDDDAVRFVFQNYISETWREEKITSYFTKRDKNDNELNKPDDYIMNDEEKTKRANWNKKY
jgi:malate synthase